MLSLDANKTGWIPDPLVHGVFYFDDVARYIAVADSAYHQDELQLQGSTIGGWSRRGFFPAEPNEFERNRRFVKFGDLITSRMIAMFLSFGVKPHDIKRAHDWLSNETGDERPFVGRRFWTEAPGIAHHINAEFRDSIVAANKAGQRPFPELLDKQVNIACRMDFDDETETPLRWHLSEGVTIDPLMASGAPCINGTRTSTRHVYESHLGGDDIGVLMNWYALTEDQVNTAIAWETRIMDAIR